MSKVIIASLPERFRRAGNEFTRAGVVIDPASLSETQIAAIKAEPMLTWREVEDDAADTGSAAKPTAKTKKASK